MLFWSTVAVIGAVLALCGFLTLVRRVRRNEIRPGTVGAMVTVFASLALHAVGSALRPDIVDGVVSIAVLFPGAVAVVILVRTHEAAQNQKRNRL